MKELPGRSFGKADFKREANMNLKRILLVIFLMSSFAFAGVEKKYDDFDGTLTIVSNVGIGYPTKPFVSVIFQCMQRRDKKTSCLLSLIRAEGGRYWTFAKVPLEIKTKLKIDEEQTEEILEAPNVSTTIRSGYISAGSWDIPEELKHKILDASEVTIRVYSNNSPQVTWSVQEKILKEWKEVITIFDEEIKKQADKSKEGAETGF
jgi:hypothetical protein